MFILVFILIVLVAGVGYLIMKSSFNIDLAKIENIMQQYGLILLFGTYGSKCITYHIKCQTKIYSKKEE